MATREYQRLSTGRYWMRTSSLWRGQGHLLLVVSSGFVERYKRFYFRDIQAVLIRPHQRREAWAFTLTLLLLLCLLVQFGLHPRHTFPTGYGAAFFAVFFAACLVGDILLGPGCVCQLKTAIQTVELPIKRLPKVQKIMRQIMPLIEEAQRTLPAGQGPAPQPYPAAATPAPSPAPIASQRPFNPLAHAFLFGTLLLGASLEAGRFFTLNTAYYLLENLVSLGVVVPLVMALIGQSRSQAPQALRRLTFAAMAYLMACYFLAIVYGFQLGIRHPDAMRDQWSLLMIGAQTPPDATTFSLFYTVLSITASAVLGLIGILELSRVVRQTPPPA